MTVWYSVLHLMVDGVCALAMFGTFLREDGSYLYLLLYNFCAFALQMPFGVVLDALEVRKREWRTGPAFWFAVAGIVCTLLGALLHPVVLGIGNALFHVGGGVGTIREDNEKGWGGRGLGVFVAPGALGLYLGMLAGKGGAWQIWLTGAGILMTLLCAGAACRLRHKREGNREICVRKGSGGGYRDKKRVLSVAVCCMLVVILRSYVGMAVTFPWKSGVLAGSLAVLVLVGGKIAGGFAAAEYGFRRTVLLSLGLGACCYLFSGSMPIGLAALFFFNMTMPLTLYGMVSCMPGREGFAFGFLTFSLFLGFLPVYFGKVPAVGGNVAGCVGSVISLLLLMKCLRCLEPDLCLSAVGGRGHKPGRKVPERDSQGQ